MSKNEGIIITLEDEETGEDVEHELPSKFEVCPRCKGKGTHVNPNIDGNGITASEWAEDWDDEEREGYLAGHYDVPCEECHGDRVVSVIDEERCNPKLLQAYNDKLRYDAEYEACCAAERRMGA